MKHDGLLQQDEAPCFYLYRQTWRGRTQTGLMALAAVAEYDAGSISTSHPPKKEQDRVDHIEILAQTGPVFLAQGDAAAVVSRVGAVRRLRAAAAGGTSVPRRRGACATVVDAPSGRREIQETFAAAGCPVRGGWASPAAASRVWWLVGEPRGADGFLAGLFPDSCFAGARIANRVVWTCTVTLQRASSPGRAQLHRDA